MKKLIPISLLGMMCCSQAFSAPVYTQIMTDDHGASVHGSINSTNMSSSGRYVAFVTEDVELFVRDIKTQATTLIAEGVTSKSVGVSPNGRYISYHKNGLNLYDRQADRHHFITQNSPTYNFISVVSNNGLVIYNEEGSEDIRIYNSMINTIRPVSLKGIPKGITEDGRLLNFISKDLNNDAVYGVFTYNLWTDEVQQINEPSGSNIYASNISGDGAKISWITNNTLYIKSLASNAIDNYDLSTYEVLSRKDNEYARHSKSLALSYSGRYIVFNGKITENHPDFNTDGTFYSDRSFRFDAVTADLIITSKTFDGSDIDGSLINFDISVSSSGSMVAFATSIENLAPGLRESAEEPHHAYISGGYDRNYLFVEMPNSENNWSMYSPMRLVGDHQWEGYLYSDGVDENALEFDAGGNWNNCTAISAENGKTRFGDSNQDGVANQTADTPIVFSSEAGKYRVTFNDETLAYSISKLNAPSFESLWIRGVDDQWTPESSVEMAFKGNNTWEAVITFANANNPRFKFDRFNDWSENYGASVVEGQAEAGGDDIQVENNKTYLVRFFEDTHQYFVEEVTSTSETQSPMCVGQSNANQDQYADIVWRHSESGDNWLYRIVESGIHSMNRFGNSTVASKWDARKGDFNGDGYVDLLWHNSQDNHELYVHLMEGDTVKSVKKVANVNRDDWLLAGVGDLDANGTSDLVWRNKHNGVVWAYLMDGATILSSKSISTVANGQWKIKAMADVDSDGYSDLIWHNASTDQLWIYFMDGTEIKSMRELTANEPLDSLSVVSVGEFLGKGQGAGLVLRDETTGALMLLPQINFNGKDIMPIEWELNSLDMEVLQSNDFNGDLADDLLVRNTISGENYIVSLYKIRNSVRIEVTYLNRVADQDWIVVK